LDLPPKSPDTTPTLLVFGGSQGAHAINQALMEAVPVLRARIPELRIIHQTGERDYDAVKNAYAVLGGPFEAHRFIDDMPACFGQADLLLCRSGASTVAEITAAAKPAIFVPFPGAADDHQKRNAEALEHAGAATMLEQANLTAASLSEAVTSLFSDRDKLQDMAHAARKLAHPHAAQKIAAMAARLSGIVPS
jgi:UDP-N-acetylglucosamine--N-acetylmuramyl-(pentapeptide) pyrophosphoryl-undecaprenol N-acetylglucosamine transferase